MAVPQLIEHNSNMARNNVDKYVEIFGRKRPRIYTKLNYRTQPTKMQFWKAMQEGGYGLMTVVAEGSEVTTSGFETSRETDFYWVKRGYGDERSYESYETDIPGLTKKIARKLAKGAEDTRESLSANQFNNATSTGAAYVGMDGVALVSTAHPDDVSWSNRGVDTGGSSNVDADLSATNLELAIQKLMDTPNDKGNPDPRTGPFILYVPTALAGLANRLTKELSPQLPGGNANDGNWAGGLISNVVVNPWLTDDDAWFLIDGSENGLFMVMHGSRLVEKDVNKRRQTIAIIMTEKLSFFCEDPRGIWGSPGA